MVSADACHISQMIHQSMLMRCSSINRVPPLWEGKKPDFLLSLLVLESESQKRLYCVSCFAAGCEKLLSCWSVCLLLISLNMLLLQKKSEQEARLHSGLSWFKTGQDTTLHQRRSYQSQLFSRKGNFLSPSFPQGSDWTGNRSWMAAKCVAAMHKGRLQCFCLQGWLLPFVDMTIIPGSM